MAGRKNQQTRKMYLGRGTTPCWEINTAQNLADIMTRLRAKCHNQKVIANEMTWRSRLRMCKTADGQTNLLRKKNQQTKKTDEKE
jgi:hypothetical protein